MRALVEILKRVFQSDAADDDRQDRQLADAYERERMRQRNAEYRAMADAIRGQIEVIVRERGDGDARHHQSS